MGIRGLSKPAQTIEWLHAYLATTGPINSYGFYQYVQSIGDAGMSKAKTEGDRQEAQAYLSVSYDSVRRLFWMLRQVGGIEFSHEEPSGRGQPRRYYRLADERWFFSGLQRVLWPSTGLGGTRYKSYIRSQRKPAEKRLPEGIEEVERPDRPYDRYWEGPVREVLPSSPKRRRRKAVPVSPIEVDEITERLRPALEQASEQVRSRVAKLVADYGAGRLTWNQMEGMVKGFLGRDAFEKQL